MQLISYVKTATNKRYSYPRVAVIWIDVHPVGETQPTHHTHPTLSPRMVLDHTYLMRSTHSNLLRSHRQSWAGSLLPRKRTSHIIHSTMADRSTGLYPVSLPSQPMKQWGAKSTFCWWSATRFTGLISPACDRYVQYLLAGVNPSALNRHKRGLQPWRCQLSTHHPLTFPTDYFHFPPNGPAQSPV
jgi:hypothetical protein